jgi:subtilisin-like proprotein convertase family protein
MNYFKLKYNLFFLLFAFQFYALSAQESRELWTRNTSPENVKENILNRRSIPNDFQIFDLNIDLLKSQLQKSPTRFKGSKSAIIIDFPNSEGKLEKYKIFEASIMDKELQEKYPLIRSYSGKGVSTSNSIRFSVSPRGFHGMIFNNEEGTFYIDPYLKNKNSYIIYSKKSLPSEKSFECQVEELATNFNKSNPPGKAENANDGNLRTFRLAIATTGEYSQFHLNNLGIAAEASEAEKKQAVLTEIHNAMTRVNAIFERDVALTMQLVANNTDVIYLDSSTDPFTNDDTSALIEESQSVIDNVIGFSNYDIGHTFSTGGGGLAYLYSPCTAIKAKGITGTQNPIGDAYYIDYVAHEMGHQFGAHHTFNSDAGDCSGNKNNGTAIEPGSGSTIMAYAGICSPENVAQQSDDYFHLVSIREMWSNINGGNSSCGELSATGNSAPLIEAIANYSIPISTPFILNASATDENGDILTYTWEQLDNEETIYPLVSTATEGPAFRSLPPSESSKRYFPNLSTVNFGSVKNIWEVVPSVGRTMNFGVTVRDNSLNGGQTASEETTITFVETAGPFTITSQSELVNWSAGTAETITWDVANTNLEPVNCSFVNILLSEDGGLTFPIVLASKVANNGSHDIVVPSLSTTKGRVKVESVDNVFYTSNSKNITIQSSEFVMNFENYHLKACAPNTVTYNITYNTFLGFNEETTFSATGLPEGSEVTFNPVSATDNDTVVTMNISGIDTNDIGYYDINVTGTSATIEKKTVISLNVFDGSVTAPLLNTPSIDETILQPYSFSWNEDVNVEQYIIEISESNDFNTILETATTETSSYRASLLNINLNYFWRVKGKNDCGESVFSDIRSFNTANEECDVVNSTDVPLGIPDNDLIGIKSQLNITRNKIISDINVKVSISHSWMEDLTLSLISPLGTEIVLSSLNGGESDGFVNTIFDSEAESIIQTGTFPFSGAYKPEEDLSVLYGQESYGVWYLKVTDAESQDIGIIDSWSLEICGVEIISDDNDKDGILNEFDQCLNTPLGAPVNSEGCVSLPSDNFTITVISETCPGKNNGQLLIESSNTELNFVTSINDIDYSFSNTQSIENLQPGSYNFCIGLDGDASFQQCFDIVIEAGNTISGKTSISSNKATIKISNGSAPFDVYVNDIFQFQTYNDVFDINVKHGDELLIKSSVECEGVYASKIQLFSEIIAYPNPTKDIFEVSLPNQTGHINVEIYSVLSRLISNKQYEIENGKIKLNLANYASGIYFVKFNLDESHTLKIVKE